MQENIEAILEFNRSTKNTHRYDYEGDTPAPLKAIYVERWGLQPKPPRIRITIEPIYD